MSGTVRGEYQPAEDGDFWSIPKTAAEWDVSAKTLWREVDRGALEVVRLGPSGRSVRTTRATREAYLVACKQ